MAKRGRKLKYTPETVELIVQALKLGATERLACEYANISQETYYNWKRNKAEFLEKVKTAQGQAAVVLLARIQQEAREGSWQAAAWLLERRYPDEYGRKYITNQHVGADGGDLRVVVRYVEGADGD